jgi:hypothetical protein
MVLGPRHFVAEALAFYRIPVLLESKPTNFKHTVSFRKVTTLILFDSVKCFYKNEY